MIRISSHLIGSTSYGIATRAKTSTDYSISLVIPKLCDDASNIDSTCNRSNNIGLHRIHITVGHIVNVTINLANRIQV
ncbi:unnamed protein product [Adineta ricciae]|uniref:Uncharacterized protein n=1 Tax=Adineta ricciae TaxID=249248 RepID=A0A815NSV5_ADIRI|nr:unnamed protein product [Adineta ricciae]